MQFPKDTRSQNAFEFVEQKKEMFLVQLSHNTIKKEIEHLSTKIDRKQKALEQSAALLNEDERIVRGHVENDNNETKALESLAEAKQMERKRKEDELKEIDSQIQNFSSEFQKHKDTLENLDKHKNFLINLSDTDFIEKQEKMKQQKAKALFDKFMKDNLDRSKLNDQKEVERVTKEFQDKLDNFLVDVPIDFYHEEIQFKDPEEISEKFAELETSNLFLIHNRQEVEQGFEELKTEEKKLIEELSKKKRAYERKLDKLESSTKDKDETFKRANIVNGKITFEDDQIFGDSTDASENIELLLGDLRKEIENVYRKFKSTFTPAR